MKLQLRALSVLFGLAFVADQSWASTEAYDPAHGVALDGYIEDLPVQRDVCILNDPLIVPRDC